MDRQSMAKMAGKVNFGHFVDDRKIQKHTSNCIL